MRLLFFAGIGVILAGLLTIGFGIPVKEFGFGNTLILTGTIVGCTGLLMLSLAAVARELKGVAEHLPSMDRAAARPKRDLPVRPESDATDAEAEEPNPAGEGPLFSRDKPAAERADAGDPATPPWQQEALRERSRGGTAAPEAAEPVAEPKQRRNLLFSSTRRERERAEAERASGAGHDAAAPASEVAPVDAPRATFEDAWPPVERARTDPPRRAARTPAPDDTGAAAPADRPAPRTEAAAEVTVLKSGVVDGMAYSLYSDGSIEAQMPEGMMRFASIDELREHLDQRS